MGAYQLNLCGFEKTYLQKLSIYLKKRLGDRILIGIWDTVSLETYLYPESETFPVIWLGDEENIERMRIMQKKSDEPGIGENMSVFLTLSRDRNCDRPDVICAYQSAEVILEFIIRHASLLNKTGTQAAIGSLQVETILDIGETRRLINGGAAYAQARGENRQVLLLDMSPCSGLTGLLQLAMPEKDFGDLILSLRRKSTVHLSDHVVHCGNMDLLPAAINPAVFYELTPEDMKRLLAQITSNGRYDMAIVLLGTPFPGAQVLFDLSMRVICLQDDGVYASCRRNELYGFYLYSGGAEEKWKDLVFAHDVVAQEAGSHLLYEWVNGDVCAQLLGIDDD